MEISPMLDAVELAPQFNKLEARTERILVVDDQPDVREALRLLLRNAGFTIETASSPEEAFAAAARGFDMIVADLNYRRDTTSGEEGLRLLESLRAQRAGAPIIAITGWSSIELAVEAMQRGACDFIPKPWDNGRFLAVIRKHLHSKSTAARALDSDLLQAHQVQKKFLPPPHFRSQGLECECVSLPVSEIGGDLYDFVQLDGGAIAFALGDASGKGIGAALLMANLQATLRANRELAKSPAALMERVNRLFFESTRPEHFATLFYVVYEPAARTIRYANCGHPSAVLLRKDGSFELLDSSATVLGAFPNQSFRECTLPVQAGDRLVLFSDGFSEAQMDWLPEERSAGWAVETILSLGRSVTNGLAAALASRAVSSGPQADDITIMDIRVL
jgi:phosphoserine phosphatase RsbU/P